MLARRLQILLDEEQYDRLAAYASERGLSVGAAVREAIDKTMPAAKASRRRAATGILAAPPMPVPPPSGLRQELDEVRGRRG
ncbi:MAG: ribbon-helix-helix protein, CopG family [Gaiella sp.]